MSLKHLVPLPAPIVERVARKAESGKFYRFAFIPPGKPSAQQIVRDFGQLTVGDCEQLVEHHLRLANRALRRFDVTGSPRTAETAADHVFRANRCRLQYYELLGQTPDPADFPFPLLSVAEVERVNVED